MTVLYPILNNSHSTRTLRVFIIILIVVLSLPLVANSSESDSLRVERLYSLSKLWGPITYFHPYLAYKQINFDSAFALAAIKVDAADSREEYASAIEDMLSCLDDPIMRVTSDTSTPVPSKCEGEALESRWTNDSVLIVSFNEECLPDYMAAFAMIDTVTALIGDAAGVIFDTRLYAGDEWGLWVGSELLASFVPSLISTSIYEPGKRSRMYDGYPGETDGYGAYFTSSFSISDGSEIKPTQEGAGCPAVFIVNELSPLPPGAYAMQNAGMASVLAIGNAVNAGVNTYDIGLADDVRVTIRTSETVCPDGTVGLQPNMILPESATSEEIFSVATELLASGDAASSPKEKALAIGQRFDIENRYSEPAYPNLGYRILAAAKIHYVMDNFFAYRDLMDEDWDGILKEFIPRFADSKDSLEYALAVAEMYAHTHDGHSFVFSKALRFFHGPSAPPILVRPIEGRTVITGMLDDSVCSAAGVEIGDVVTEIDGINTARFLDSLKRYRAAANSVTHDYYATKLMVRGPDSSTIKLTVEGKDNRIRNIQLPRLDRYRSLLSNTERFGSDTIQILDGNIGYVDLDRLAYERVDVMFDSLKDTRAIIFDMRGYPNGTGFSIAPRLTTEPNVSVARFESHIVLPPTTYEDGSPHGARKFFEQANTPAYGFPYEGLTVMLIDERTQSQAEHTGLLFEASNGTKFIGSQTAGTNGDVTKFCIPGGANLMLTGFDVRHADGRQLQRIGLVPDVEVKPTIEGIRAGKDEVLEAAIKYVNEVLGTP